MSAREIAYNIFQQLSEEQLEGFVALFKRYYPTLEVQTDKQSDLQKSREAFEQLQKMIKPCVHEIDEEKEREEYMKEKYGL